MRILNLMSRLTITDPDIGRAIHTSFWQVEVTSGASEIAVCKAVAAELVGPGAWSNGWCLVLPRGAFLTRFQVGIVGHGFYADERLTGIDFEGTRLLILFPGLQKAFINGRITWVSGFTRLAYSQIPFVWKHDFTNDEIWEPYFVLLSQVAELWLSDFTTADGDLFYFVNRSHQLLFVRPFTYRVERRTSRQLHRRSRVEK